MTACETILALTPSGLTRRRGFTLAELVVSMAVMSILMVGLGSAILIASHALPERNTSTDALVEASELVDQMAGELNCALAFTERSGTSVEFTVPDRNADLAAETIRYAWSGTPGDPLTRRYNGGTVVTVSEEVQDFSLAYFVEVGQSPDSPTVLFVVNDPSGPVSTGPQKAAMESWGFTVQLVDDDASDADFATAMTTCDAAYIHRGVNSAAIGTRLRDAPIGVVNEDWYLCNEFGFSWSSAQVNDFQISITDNTHEITSGFAIGDLNICTSTQPLFRTAAPLAAGGQGLADLGLGAALLVIEVGGQLYGGGNAPARRVKLPWGTNTFDFPALNSDGQTIMQRAIEWAAAPPVCTAVQIVLQAGQDSARRVETQVRLLNRPEVAGT